jgi:hypothetical protein
MVAELGSIDEISRSLGELNAHFANLLKRQDEDRVVAGAFRKEMRDKIESMDDKLGPLLDRVDKIEPFVAKLKEKATEARGAWWATRLIYGAGATVVGLAGATIADLRSILARIFH